jgi:hypothetical protein
MRLFRSCVCSFAISFSFWAPAARSENTPDPNRGLYAIWVRPGVAESLPFLKGGQVKLQWAQVERTEGHYEFGDLDRQLEEVAHLGRVTTVQLNANQIPAFLFDKVPSTKAMLNQEQDRRGTLQYWHPAYVKAYTNLIAQFAKAVKASNYRSHVIGVRLNYNALGTEGLVIPPEDRDPGKWTAPSGATVGPAWTDQVASAYLRTVLDEFIRDFNPEIRVFMRAGIFNFPSPDPESLRLAGAGDHNVGFFTTGSEIEPRTPSMQERYQKLFLPYCRSGKAVCYAESMADAAGVHGRLKDPRWCPPDQYNYWRLLADLNLGFSMIGIYGSDLEQAGTPEYKAAFEFAARYVGYQASPSIAPGAWVALRSDDLFKDDYTFLMRRLPGAELKAEKKAGPDDQRFGAWAMTLAKGDEVKFGLDPVFARSLAGKKAILRVTYLDRNEGTFTVRASGREFHGKLGASGRWKTAEFEIDKAAFTADGGAQIALRGDADVTLHMVEVAR